jgi:hypothetical protein
MSTTAKLGLAAISAMLAAYLLGCRLGAPDALAAWRTYYDAVALTVCLTAFVRQLLALHATLLLLSEKHSPLRQADGKLLIP